MLLFPVIAIGVGIAVFFGVRKVKEAHAAWERAAATLGMSAKTGGMLSRPSITGSLGPFDAEIDTYTERSGNNSRTFTRYRVFYPPLGLGLKLTPQHALHRITKFFGAQDVEVGDRAFDDALLVKADDPTRAAAFLTTGTRTSLLRLFSTFGGAVVDDHSITVRTSGLERNEQKLVSTIRRVAAVARRLRDLDDDAASVDRLLKRRLDGELGETAEELRSVIHPHPDDLDGRLLEAEALATAGRRKEAAAALDDLATALPADPEVRGWQEYLQAPPPSRPAPTPVDGIEDDRFFDTLFASTQMSYETTKLFEQRYEGRPVTWSGHVKDARRYDKDYDFGPGPGTKAVITVATIEHDLYGQTEIDAVVQLPAAAASLRRKDTVTFSGVLLRVDPLMRNVYVTDGRLTSDR